MTKNLASGWTVDQVNALSLENKRLREELDALRAVAEACQRLDKAKQAMEAAGFKIVLPDEGEMRS